MNLYLKVFLTMAVPFGGLTGFVVAGDAGILQGITTGTAVGATLGFVASAILVTLHNRAVNRLPFPDNVKNYAVKQSKSIFVDWDYDTAFQRCAQALNDYGCRQIQPNPLHGTIVSKSKLDVFAALQAIGMRVIEHDPGDCEIQIISQPKMPTTMLDFGRNLRNVEELAQRLRQFEEEDAEREREEQLDEQ